ncbi:MAG: hypothetical protein COS34_10770 [Lysobacterales bacterium CG02_land_8_20_14_3_00_62_12]|nr:MAG: hypothetical protein COS34_10770 [Xanthomonadales bacterium CG02_land_8_20_14_3_00_62_12]
MWKSSVGFGACADPRAVVGASLIVAMAQPKAHRDDQRRAHKKRQRCVVLSFRAPTGVYSAGRMVDI